MKQIVGCSEVYDTEKMSVRNTRVHLSCLQCLSNCQFDERMRSLDRNLGETIGPELRNDDPQPPSPMDLGESAVLFEWSLGRGNVGTRLNS